MSNYSLKNSVKKRLNFKTLKAATPCPPGTWIDDLEAETSLHPSLSNINPNMQSLKL